MKASCLYHQISINNPGYIYDYSLSVYGKGVEIRIRSPILGHTGGCLLSYKLQDGKVQWLQQQKTIWYATHDNLRIIQYLRNLPQKIFDNWMANPIKIPIMPIEILRQIQKMEGQQITKISERQSSIIHDRRKKDLFAENQRRQIQNGQIQCTFCTDLLIPSKYHQLKCGHCFHYPCIKKYCHQIKNQCPICKYSPKRQ